MRRRIRVGVWVLFRMWRLMECGVRRVTGRRRLSICELRTGVVRVRVRLGGRVAVASVGGVALMLLELFCCDLCDVVNDDT